MVLQILTLLCVQTSYINPFKIPTVKIDENVNINNIGVTYLQMNIDRRPIVCPVMSYVSSRNLKTKSIIIIYSKIDIIKLTVCSHK